MNEKGDREAYSDYYPFGMAMVPSEIPADKYRHGYQGQYAEKDEETGYNAFELRMYDPVIGRWMGPDPYRQFYSAYIGMGNNPVSSVDPDGGWVDPPDRNGTKDEIAFGIDGPNGDDTNQLFYWDDGNQKWDIFQQSPEIVLGRDWSTSNIYNHSFNGGFVGFNQDEVDFWGTVGGGFSTIFGTSAQYSNMIKGASRFGVVGAFVSGGVYANAVASNQAKTSHHVDAVLTGTFLILSSNPLTASFGIPMGLAYGGIRLIGGTYIDNIINERFYTPTTNSK